MGEQIDLPHNGLVSDAHPSREPDPLLREPEHLVHEDTAALTHEGHVPNLRLDDPFTRQEKGIEV